MQTRITNVSSNEFLNKFKENLIRDFDLTIKNYFSDILKLTVIEDNDKRKLVPVNFGTFERWYQNKKDDNKEQINRQTDYPRMFIKQNAIEISDDKYIPKNKHNKVITKTNYIGKDIYGKPIWEIANITVPTFIEISYDISFYCFYANQTNEIIEQILSKDSKVPIDTSKGFHLTLKLDSFSDNSNFDDFTDEQRLSGKTFAATLSGNFFIGKDLNDTNITRQYTTPKVVVRERVYDYLTNTYKLQT